MGKKVERTLKSTLTGKSVTSKTGSLRTGTSGGNGKTLTF